MVAMAKLAPARSSVDCGLARRATRLSSSFPFPSRARQVARAKVPDSPCAAASQRGGQPTRRRAHAPRRPAPSRGLPPARTQASACGCVSWPSAPPRLARPSLARPTSARTPLRGPALRPLPPSRASGLPCPPRARSSPARAQRQRAQPLQGPPVGACCRCNLSPNSQPAPRGLRRARPNVSCGLVGAPRRVGL
jgi:hypothetical protein